MPAYNMAIEAKWLAIFNVEKNTITGLTDHGKTLSQILVPSKIYDTNITSIGDSAFNCIARFESVIIENGITFIGYEAFKECGLTSITIPNSVTSIGNYAFYDCRGLTSVYYRGTETE